MIDSTIVRARQHSAGSKKGGLNTRPFVDRAGGLSTRIQMVVRGFGNRVRFAPPLIDLSILQKGWSDLAI